MVKLGVVEFLNSRPLIERLSQRPDVQCLFDVPARLPARLESGEVDAALIPVFDVIKSMGRLRVVSDACIASDGETMTVRVFSQVPPDRLRSLAVDVDSHTSVALVRVLWRELYGRELELHAAELRGAASSGFESVLLIGDKVVDPARGLAYVYHGDSAERRPVISVVDLRAGQVVKLFRLGATSPIGHGRLLLAPDGGTLYAMDGQNETFAPVDVETGAIGPAVSGIRDGVLSEDGRILYAIGPSGVRAYETAALLSGNEAALWEVGGARYEKIVRNGETLLASALTPARGLVSYDAATGREVARVALDYATAIAPGPDGGWAATVSGEQMRLIRYDAALAPVAEAVVPYTNDVTYDADFDRYLIAGYLPSQDPGGGPGGEPGGGSTKEMPVVWGLSAGDLTRVAEQAWPDQQAPTVFVPWGSDRLLGFAPAGAARLALLDRESLAPEGRIITGVHAIDLVLDDGAGVLYVADDHDRIHVLRLPDGAVSAV